MKCWPSECRTTSIFYIPGTCAWLCEVFKRLTAKQLQVLCLEFSERIQKLERNSSPSSGDETFLWVYSWQKKGKSSQLSIFCEHIPVYYIIFLYKFFSYWYFIWKAVSFFVIEIRFWRRYMAKTLNEHMLKYDFDWQSSVHYSGVLCYYIYICRWYCHVSKSLQIVLIWEQMKSKKKHQCFDLCNKNSNE